MPERTHILHRTERSLWDVARAHGAYRMSTRGRTLDQEGFVHCSTRAQLPSVAALSYGSYEAPEAGEEKFPHVYRPTPVDAVVRVEPWR
ncbi:DUF952 domain-containing protein [Streptomyces sp. NPDC057052]|uniref:DUF952 domain-containing protein n=1 Tax=Streptomyces sp. NPDC057052 TaxID=3346010 RepID=UPI0036369BDB